MLLTATTVQAQVNIQGKVFGGARQADVGGHTYVNIGADKHDVIINAVYGGNDISGTIGSSTKPDGVDEGNHVEGLANYNAFVRTDKEATGKHLFIGQLFGGGYGDYDYSDQKPNGKYDVPLTYTVWDPSLNNGAGGLNNNHSVTLSNINKPELDKAYVDLHGGTFGYVFGGGDNVTVNEATNICINNTSTRTKTADEDGGLALLTDQRLLDMGINTKYFNQIDNHVAGVDKFLFSRVFGGNNKADMHIRPSWHLQDGSIENLYSGGNEGRMTSSNGLLLQIGSKAETSNINIYNVYGGCRKADVRPLNNDGTDVTHVYNIEGYNFPPDFAARVLVYSGKIHNVYGGNDVRGRVYFGNAVGVRTNISGDIYGGGNGSYPYTDNPALANDLIYGDFYYNPTTELEKAGVTAESAFKSVTALNLVRPNAEQVSIRIADNRVTDEMTDEAFNALKSSPILIGGSVYCGGNSATLKSDPAHNNISNNYPVVELKIGSNIVVDKVFLGNNGANMVDQSDGGLLAQYHGSVTDVNGNPQVFSSLDLTDSGIFAEYMKGCALDIIPRVNFDSKELNQDAATYRDYSAYIGSFYCGGNVGSMTYNDVKPMNFNRKIIIFDKLVGGCNNAIIPAKDGVNANYEGGLVGTPNSTTGNKVELTLSGIKIEPKRWITDNNGNKTGLEWNTIYASTGENTPAIETTEAYDTGTDENGDPLDYHLSDDNDLDRRFQHGHIYGGCYSSGIVNGNVVINIDGHLIEREKLFDVVKTDDLGEEESLYGADQTHQERFKITERKTGVLLAQQGMDVLGAALNVFGGGKGKATEIWGNTTINMNAGYTFQVFGGSEEGVIGKPGDGTGDDGTGDNYNYSYSYKLKYIGTDIETPLITKTYKYNPKYSCYVNLCGANAGVSKQADQSEAMAECEFMYGGGFLGPICGNTYVNLGNGRIFNSFAGSCNADILGHTETYIGRSVKAGPLSNPHLYKNDFSSHANDADGAYYEAGFPWVRDYTYGGNDLGGRIMQQVDFSSKVRDNTIKGMVYKNTSVNANPEVLKANAYTEYLQGRAEGIFGGCYGTYDYTNPKFEEYFYTTGGTGTTTENLSTARSGYSKPYIPNAFVNFRPTYNQVNNMVNKVYGAGQGYPGERDRDHLQDYSYVLIDIPQDMAYYKEMEVFGAGAWSGVGMRTKLGPNLNPDDAQSIDLDHHSTIIDLVRGQIGAAYGGSYAEGITRRTVVNVPEGSTITIGSIFGGAYGTKTLPSCDVLDANVEYHSADATLVYDPETSDLYQGSLYGGNNNERRTLSAYVNIDVPVVQRKVIQYNNEIQGWNKGQEMMTNGTVYGAGRGVNTWSEYTLVNLSANPDPTKEGATVWEVYGGGQLGHVLNAQTVQAYMQLYKTTPSPDIPTSEYTDWTTAWKKAWSMDQFYEPNADYDNYAAFIATEMNAARPRTELDENEKTKALLGGSGSDGTFFNTNVLINKGATVMNYAYGGGLGKAGLANSGDVWGTTYIALLGGTVRKDLYAAGTSGGVLDAFAVGAKSSTNPLGFTASANAYIQGGTARNVYGGGWEGSVGKHKKFVTEEGKTVEVNANIDDPYTNDIYGETNVVIGILEEDLAGDPDYHFYNGVPAIQRNAYGGGEGGPVYGTTNLIFNNGYVGYEYTKASESATTNTYVEKIVDETWKDKDGHFIANTNLYDSGCIFGGGYVDNSSVDVTNVTMYGGQVRNALFGGGEIAAIGRGVILVSGENNSKRSLKGIYKAGKTNVKMLGGHVHRNVFGGGRGYNNLGEGGSLYSDGYVFGQTEVHIHGGEIGTDEEVALGNGNVFGGGDIGYVYSAHEENGIFSVGIKDGNRYDDNYEGYYYKFDLSPGKVYEAETATTIETKNKGDWAMDGTEYILTEDCKVLIEPQTKVVSQYGEPVLGDDGKPTYDENGKLITTPVTVTSVEINGTTYYPGDYVPIDDLNMLENKNADKDKWNCLDPSGVIIHNAVFAGGNTSSGSASVYANATSVFGNATASVHDVFHRDLITLGTGHTGGLYGDGNLTFVDGYRGLNITNYGTDYHSISKEVTIDQYHNLPEREAAYYELKYKCKSKCEDKDGTVYTAGDANTKASTITADDLLTLFVESNGTSVRVDASGNRITTGEGGTAILTLVSGKWVPNSDYWEENGVLPVYAGRLMNTIQRADFCGVFGSRMVMQGAQDRVPEIVDYTNYTINRVREVSLNQQHTEIVADRDIPESSDDYEKKAVHGNYFGIYSIVNYLGALSSDVHFKPDVDVRKTTNTSSDYAEDGKTYYQWKSAHIKDRKRNNGSSLNKVALASGVYLELTTEKSTGTELRQKDWGYITGVIELDLINVQKGLGGGFVYAKNEHGKPKYEPLKHNTLTALNKDAITRKDFKYSTSELYEWETSGNFVHSTQTIIDDCYNISNKYKGNDAVPAHYWYIKGSVYVYDQYISAYTGAPNAYSESVNIPLTITAASHGKMKLLDVQPNMYAYWKSSEVPLDNEQKLIINDVTYYKNDPISYWDYFLLSQSEKNLFEKDTYVVIADCKIGNDEYKEGTVMTQSAYQSLRGETPPTVTYTVTNSTTGTVTTMSDKPFDYFFRSSNNLSHDTGYILTYEVNNPTDWNKWYTEFLDSSNDSGKAHEKQQTKADGFNSGPTYYLTGAGAVLGQQTYAEGDLISKTVFDTYEGDGTENNRGTGYYVPDGEKAKQATFVPAYLVTKQITIPGTGGSGNTHLYPGAAVSATTAGSYTGSVAPAFICTATIKVSKTEYILLNTRMTQKDINDYIKYANDSIKNLSSGLSTFSDDNNEKTDMSQLTPAQLSGLSDAQKENLSELLTLKKDLNEKIEEAYYCTKEGPYGGNYYESGKNYRGLDAWSSMSETDRRKFAFNYDALDLLIDPYYSRNESGTLIHKEGEKYQYDGSNYTTAEQVKDETTGNKAGYSLEKPVDYTAEYDSDTDLDLGSSRSVNVKRDGNDTPIPTSTIQKGDELSREVFEKQLINEQRHYAPITPKADDNYIVYVVKTPFQIGSTPYTIGQTISRSEYNSLGADQSCIDILNFNSSDAGNTYYYCRESYDIAAGGHQVKSIGNNTNTYAAGATATVPIGAVIAAGNTTVDAQTYYGFTNLTNEQKDFTIHGIAPTETSTLFVSRESDIFDLSTEKIITVIYEYDYEETDQNGNITPLSERHVVNIHIQFKSGVPSVEDIKAPQIILPGDKVSLREPHVTPGAYEVSGGGWELFEDIDDAESHTNGIEYSPLYDPLYWYQHDWYVAYYAKTYLGKTYSNAVQVSVANYHDLKKVMEAKEHHYYVDNPDVLRESKIYINDYSNDDTGSQNGLDLLKDLFDLSILDNPTVSNTTGLITSDDFTGHKPLDSHVKAGKNLIFTLRTDIDHTGSEWTPIGRPDNPSTEGVDESQCFDGTLHGDGYHLSGLDHSLFLDLCGEVYNLGVSGSFTTAGVADLDTRKDGYVENCWVKSTATSLPANQSKLNAVFGNPTDTEGYQIVNSYFWDGNKNLYNTTTTNGVITSGGARGTARAMSESEFYNGTVAYNLNGFYLYKRYCDKEVNSSVGVGQKYQYFKTGSDNNQAYYTSNPDLCSSGYKPAGAAADYVTGKYVEDRFADGDFIYAGGSIPDDTDKHLYTDPLTKETGFYAIWPDDYLFFGQTLSYGHDKTRTHQEVPSRYATSNRVLRAPAYFRSWDMSMAHFNPDAVLTDKENLSDEQIAENVIAREVYKKMTAIDLTGYNDNVTGYDYQKGWSQWSATSQKLQSEGMSDKAYAFYPPLLDDGVTETGLSSIICAGLTPNLLVYTGAPAAPEVTTPTAVQNTATVVGDYLKDAAYNDHVTSNTYNTTTVKAWDSYSGEMHGHWVQKSGESYVATRDHYLVDKEDFNAPMQYTFQNGSRMWHQRLPDNYVDRKKGWEAISLPFTAELVTTDDKGEITHFYNGSYDYFDKDVAKTHDTETDTKVGHEYWLREFNGVKEETKDVAGTPTTIANGDFKYPVLTGDGSVIVDNKTVDNTFFWDYYYKGVGHDQNDNNYDKYQEYYGSSRTFTDYPLLTKAVPYIIGFPGKTYYEFDLSGDFVAGTTAEVKPAQLGKQTITFVSPVNTTIYVSDMEMDGKSVTYDGKTYTFKPSYLNEELAVVTKVENNKTSTTYSYVLNTDGSAYDKVPDNATAEVAAFRPYFSNTVTTSNARPVTRSIIFSDDDSQLKGILERGDPTKEEAGGTLNIYAKKHKIVVESALTYTTDVRIVNMTGMTVNTFTIEPGETVETRINTSGVYIVQTTDGHYIKKLAVR